MFRRAFMESFKVRKNAIPSAYLGSISSNFAIIPRRERIGTRLIIFFATTVAMINATNDFEIFYEIFYHLPQPAHKTYYEHDVPKEIREANDDVIEKWKKVHEARKLLKTYQV